MRHSPTELANSGSKKFPWREWLAAVLWLALIALESTTWFSFQNTGHALEQLLAAVLGPVNSGAVTVANTALRETGHVIGYAVLSWLFFRALRANSAASRAAAWALSWAGAAFLMTAVVASLDEFHQTFLPGRTGRLRDVFLDSAAALAAQFLLFALARQRRARVREKTTVAVGD